MFSEVLLGIKSVIQTHLLDVQFKFEDHFQSLGQEIRNRDVMINQLQHRIQELENGHVSPTNNPMAATSGTGNGSTGSSSDIGFVVSMNGHFHNFIAIKLSFFIFDIRFSSAVIHWILYLHHHLRQAIVNVKIV